ncbi:hypothetical protein BU17DRAFT_66779 [Hysterangium stoloniferum]|nr:hypothetical protein BU17DRAFT_66779 [Hysterangium stoloniferum]
MSWSHWGTIPLLELKNFHQGLPIGIVALDVVEPLGDTYRDPGFGIEELLPGITVSIDVVVEQPGDTCHDPGITPTIDIVVEQPGDTCHDPGFKIKELSPGITPTIDIVAICGFDGHREES